MPTLPIETVKRTPVAAGVWWLVAVLALMMASYAALYVIIGPPMYGEPLAESFLARPWGIYPHALFGALATAAAPFQFRKMWLVRRPHWHRRFGLLYICSAWVTGISGVYMSLYSFGGMTTHVAFAALGSGLLLTTTAAYRSVLRRKWAQHREWMIRSFALLFAAVILRIEVPILMFLLGGFEPAYLWVSWLCWVPNLAAAEIYIQFTRHRNPLGFLRERSIV